MIKEIDTYYKSRLHAKAPVAAVAEPPATAARFEEIPEGAPVEAAAEVVAAAEAPGATAEMEQAAEEALDETQQEMDVAIQEAEELIRDAKRKRSKRRESRSSKRGGGVEAAKADARADKQWGKRIRETEAALSGAKNLRARSERIAKTRAQDRMDAQTNEEKSLKRTKKLLRTLEIGRQKSEAEKTQRTSEVFREKRQQRAEEAEEDIGALAGEAEKSRAELVEQGRKTLKRMQEEESKRKKDQAKKQPREKKSGKFSRKKFEKKYVEKKAGAATGVQIRRMGEGPKSRALAAKKKSKA